MLLDIIILPPKNFRTKFGKLGLRIKSKLPVFFSVDDKKLIPHISLFHIRTFKAVQIIIALPKLLAQYKSLMIHPGRFASHKIGHSHFVGLEIKNTSALQALHEAVVLNLYNFKSGPAMKPQNYYNQKQTFYRIHYGGNPHMLEFFSPHLTLAKLKMLNSKQQSELMRALNVKFPSFKAGVVALAQTDNEYQVTKILKRFKLRPAK